MQNAKDTFYITLRNRLTTVNPERTMLLRAVVRPGILVQEAEAPAALPRLDAFTLCWTALETDLEMATMLARMSCEIQYSTAGTQGNAGLDRGRSLAAMDSELLQILYPYATQKMNYAQTPALPMETMVFWSEPEFEPVVTLRDRLSRRARVTVFAFEEQGEA